MLIVAEQHPENFLPLTLTRASFELRYGALAPLDRALLLTPEVALRCRPELADYLRARTGLPVNEDIEGDLYPGLPADTPWEILGQSDQCIAGDYEMWCRHHPNQRRHFVLAGVHLLGNPVDLHVGYHVELQPGCVLDVRQGPIILGDRSVVRWSHLQGPVFVGPGCHVEAARLRPGTSLGPNCKVGGEVSASIFQSRVNKAHDGFVGHTWAGRWVNFGAMATTSNLKNTYGTIRFQRDSETLVETGEQFLGSLIGDHTKLGIGQLLTSGSYIGVCCNIFGGGVAPRYVPSYSWGGVDGWEEHRLEQALKTVSATLGRRNARLRPESESVLMRVFEHTQPERARFLQRQSDAAV